MKTKLLIIDRGQLGILTDTLKYCEYLHCHFNITYICFDEHRKKIEIPQVKIIYVSSSGGKLFKNVRFLITCILYCLFYKGKIFTVYFPKCHWLKKILPFKKMHIDIRTLSVHKSLEQQQIENKSIEHAVNVFDSASFISKGIKQKLHLKTNLPTFILPLGADIISHTDKDFNCLKLLYMGTLSNRHIIDTVKGVKMFKDKYPEIPLIYSIIGDGEELYEIKNYIHMQKLESTIHTYGRLPYSELKPFLDTHNIGISYIPQLECYEYQPPTKTFEYALSGLYTIATNTYENRQVIHSNNGILINDTISVKNVINYFYHFEAAQKIEQLVKDEKPDIAHIHLLWGQITPSIFPVLKRYNIPILFTVHDYRIVCPAYTFRNGKGIICEDCKGKYFYKCFTHTCCKGSKAMSAVMAAEQYFRNWFFNPAKYIDGFLYVSKFAKEIQEKYMPEVRQTHNITLYNFTTSIATTSKQIPTNKYFLFFGRLSYEKGVKTLLKAFKELPECNLKIVGTGPKEKELKLFVSNNSMNNVEFLGYKRGLELIDLVKNAYFVIVPSEWYENNPMTIIEAYSVGTPVIGAKIGGIPEIIIDGKTGYQFTTGNSDNLQETIKKIFSLTPEAYQRLSAGTLEFAHENLSLENYYPRLIAFYSHFLKQE